MYAVDPSGDAIQLDADWGGAKPAWAAPSADASLHTPPTPGNCSVANAPSPTSTAPPAALAPTCPPARPATAHPPAAHACWPGGRRGAVRRCCAPVHRSRGTGRLVAGGGRHAGRMRSREASAGLGGRVRSVPSGPREVLVERVASGLHVKGGWISGARSIFRRGKGVKEKGRKEIGQGKKN